MLANSAANDRIVAGFVSVSPTIDAKAATGLLEPASVSARAAGPVPSVAQGRAQRPDRHDHEDHAADEPEQPVDADEQLGDGREAERGDGAVGRVGGRHADAGEEPVGPAAVEGAADDEQADRAEGERDGEPDRQAAQEQLEGHGRTPVEHRRPGAAGRVRHEHAACARRRTRLRVRGPRGVTGRDGVHGGGVSRPRARGCQRDVQPRREDAAPRRARRRTVAARPARPSRSRCVDSATRHAPLERHVDRVAPSG